MTKLGEPPARSACQHPLRFGLWPRALSLLPPLQPPNFASKYYIHFSNMVFHETNKKYEYSISTYQNLYYEADDKTVLLYHNQIHLLNVELFP